MSIQEIPLKMNFSFLMLNKRTWGNLHYFEHYVKCRHFKESETLR